jgi:hypothetical protein
MSPPSGALGFGARPSRELRSAPRRASERCSPAPRALWPWPRPRPSASRRLAILQAFPVGLGRPTRHGAPGDQDWKVYSLWSSAEAPCLSRPPPGMPEGGGRDHGPTPPLQGRSSSGPRARAMDRAIWATSMLWVSACGNGPLVGRRPGSCADRRKAWVDDPVPVALEDRAHGALHLRQGGRGSRPAGWHEGERGHVPEGIGWAGV